MPDAVVIGAGPNGLVAANLLAPLLRTWAARLGGVGERPERVIAGGLLVGEGDAIAEAFAAAGYAEATRRADGEWAALLLVRH